MTRWLRMHEGNSHGRALDRAHDRVKNRAPSFARRLGYVLSVTASIVSLALVAQGIIYSNASWNDSEWGHSVIGTSNCDAPNGAFASRGEGRVLSGSLLGLDLDNLAEAKGVEATNNGTRSKRDPVSAMELGNDAYSNPLDIELLNAVGLNLTSVLDLPLDTETGAIGQYAQATGAGEAVGASGTVTNDGGISLEQFNGDVPDLATLKLSTLLNATGIGLDDLLQDVTDLELVVGAVGGRAWLDGCRDIWGLPDSLYRDYLTSHLDLNLTSPTVAALGTTVSDTVSTLEDSADALVGNGNALDSVLGEVLQLVTGALGLVTGLVGIRLVGDDATASLVSIDLDLQPVRDLLDDPISDDEEVVSITLSEGLIQVDLVALVSAAYEGEPNTPYPNGLNGLAENTEPLKDDLVLTELTNRLSGVLHGIVSTVDTMLLEALNGAHIEAEISIPIEKCSGLVVVVCLGSWQNAGDLLIKVSGTLTELLNNASGVVTIDTSALLGGLLGGLVTTLVDTVLGVLTPVLGALVGNVVLGAVGDLAKLPADIIVTTVNPILTLVSDVYENLFLDDVIAVTINAQSDPVAGNPEPFDWSVLEEGRFDVAAIRVGVLDALGDSAVMLYLGRGSVGLVCSLAEAGQACVDY